MPEPDVKEEDRPAAAAVSEVIKVEPKEDLDAPPSKKRTRQKVKEGEAKDEDGTAKRKKDEDEDADEQGNEEDAMAPEAEPTHDRNEVPEGTTKFREDAVHVYGLDFLKTGHMEEIFGQFNHKYVEWINDSSANVVFRDAASARKALESLSYPKAGDDPWRRTPDILVHDDLPAVFLQMRLATSSDCKKGKKSVPSMNPPAYVDEANRRNPQFTVASLYDKRPRPPPSERKRGTPRPLPEEEVTKRQRRADRFAATLGDPPVEKAAETPAANTEVAEATPSKSPGKTTLSPEEVAEEKARREKRALRFGSAAEKTADNATEEKASGAAAPTGDSASAAAETEGGDTAAPATEAPAANSPEAC